MFSLFALLLLAILPFAFCADPEPRQRPALLTKKQFTDNFNDLWPEDFDSNVVNDQDYDEGTLLGEGTSGSVILYSAKPGHQGPQQVAVKFTELQNKSPEDCEGAIREMLLLKVIDHPNVMKLFGGYVGSNVVILACEYFPEGTLEEYEFGAPKFGQLTDARIIKFAKDLFSALEYLHHYDILHLDIKPANVMIHGDSIKLIDFGFGTEPSEEPRTHDRFCGSLLYASPEILNHIPYGSATDVWSAGMTIFVLYDFPYRCQGELTAERLPTEQCKYKPGKQLARKFVRIPAALRNAIKSALAYYDVDRASAAEVGMLLAFVTLSLND